MSIDTKGLKTRKAIWPFVLAIACILVVGIIAIFIIFGQKNTIYEYQGEKRGYQANFTCATDQINSSLYSQYSADSTDHLVTMIFVDNNLTEMTYRYRALLNDRATAEKVKQNLQSTYTLNWQKSFRTDPFYSTYNVMDDVTVIISHYVKREALSSKSASLLLLDFPDLKPDQKITPADIMDQYVQQGFNCKQK